MKDIVITVLGNPKGLKRHRSVRCGKFIRQYDPSAPDKADFLAMAYSSKPDEPTKGRVMIRVDAYFPRPKTHYNSKGILRDTAPSAHTSRPDYDNILKFISDALNGVFYHDDSQIFSAYITKLYDENPRTVVKLTYFD
jgi:Holliday junction resolvase RusA-like endonuclease